MLLYDWMKKEFHYSEYKINIFHYFIISTLSEFSKFIILGIYFYSFSLFKQYLFAFFLLCILRFYSGGLHCKSYIGCITCSWIYLVLSIQIFPRIILPLPCLLIGNTVFIIVDYICSPVVSNYRPCLTAKKKKKCKIIISIILISYFVLILFYSNNSYIVIGFWIIFLHTIQLAIGKKQTREVKRCS